MKKTIFLLFTACCSMVYSIYAQVPAGYYDAANQYTGYRLQRALCNIIDSHRVVSYNSLWDYFAQTDLKENGTVWDIYSDTPNAVPFYEFTFSEDQCGTIGSSEGGCYNREHIFCQSWFGAGTGAPYSDMFHIYPVDGYINSTRNNNAFGEVSTPTRTFLNGSKYGINTFTGAPAAACFEPIDEYKGDIARSFFYMATRYMNEDAGFAVGMPMTSRSQLLPWAIALLKNWHLLDPVSNKEIERNNAVYAIQHNRNPFIDHPELVAMIWGNDSIIPFYSDSSVHIERPAVVFFQNSNNRLIIRYDMPVDAMTAQNKTNYYLSGNIVIDSARLVRDTVTLTVHGSMIPGQTYHLFIRNIKGANGHFIKDTVINFSDGETQPLVPFVGWTFDRLEEKPQTPTVIIPDMNPRTQNAVILLNGDAGSSLFQSLQLDAQDGTTIGDPRHADALAGKALTIVGATANTQKCVIRFSSSGFSHLFLSIAVRKTSTGFQHHAWEWSLDGVFYEPVPLAQTVPVQNQQFELLQIDLSDLTSLANRDSVFLRFTVDSATGNNGNNRFDNIILYGEQLLSVKKKVTDKIITVLPNPCREKLLIKLPYSALLEKKLSLYLYSLDGAMQAHKQIHNLTTTVNTGSLPAGTYLICIRSEDESFSFSIPFMHIK